MIRENCGEEMSVSEIAKEMGVSRPTVRKYLKAMRPMEFTRKNRMPLLEPYKAYRKDSIDRYILGVRVLEEAGKNRYKGRYPTLKPYGPH